MIVRLDMLVGYVNWDRIDSWVRERCVRRGYRDRG